MKKAFLLFCICILIIIFLYIGLKTQNGIKPIVVGNFALENVPKNVVVSGDNSGLFFINHNDTLQSVEISETDLIFSDIKENVSQISVESNVIAVVDKNNFFSFLNAEEKENKKIFSDVINEKGKTADILKITSGNEFTVVLFSDGSVYSDINYYDTEAAGNSDFIIFNDCNIKDVSASEYQILAIDYDNTVYYYRSIPKKQPIFLKKPFYENLRNIYSSADVSSYLLTENGDVYSFDNAVSKNEINILKMPGLENIKELNIGYSNCVTLAYSNNGKIFHWGLGYIYNKPIKYIPVIIVPELIYEGDHVAHFVGTSYGIVVITTDGTMRIIKN